MDLVLYCGVRVAADLVVLTVEALEVAVGEEDVADALGAADDGLFAAVEADGAYAESSPCAAVAQLAVETPRMALARAGSAGAEFFQTFAKDGFH